jgi:hypothetical protein
MRDSVSRALTNVPSLISTALGGLRANRKSRPQGGPLSDAGPEVGLGDITTPSGVFQPEFVVHCLAESLLAAEITFGGLNRCVSKQELNLLKFSAR